MQLNIAKIFYESGKLQYRYARCRASDGARWIGHGLFTAVHENGQLASEGNYVHGLENGIWRDFHENGRLAVEGRYEKGKRRASGGTGTLSKTRDTSSVSASGPGCVQT